MTTRREFLFRTAAAVGLSAWANGDRSVPSLRLGVLSDVHIHDDDTGKAVADVQ